MTDHRGPIPVPARITLALDSRGMFGAWVDEACGVAEPAVDQWEAGELVPTRHQVELLAELTGYPVEFFYRPFTEADAEPWRMFICERDRRGENGLTILETHVDYAGVLQVKQLTPDRPPRRERKPKATEEKKTITSGHDFDEERGAPGWCVCGAPKAHRSHRKR